jgi:acyl carrier protein
LEIVRAALLALELPDVTAEQIRAESSLLHDFGIDSLKFVDLTVNLEDGFGIETFPMQAWVDRQRDAGSMLTVGELAAACRQCLSEGARDPVPHG